MLLDDRLFAIRTGGNDVDGILAPEVVADCIVDGVREGRFLILPHAQVAEYVRRKSADRDRWIAGMQRSAT